MSESTAAWQAIAVPAQEDDLSLLGALAERFSEQVRLGQAPSVEQYAADHPELAERIRQLFPTLLLLEGVGSGGSGALAPGRLFGRYLIEREIGRGGMGVVYLAVHQALQKPVALKVLARGGPADARSLARFLREAQTAAGLHHTHIVPVFDVGQVDGTVYYAMQYIDGVGLDEVLRRADSFAIPPLGSAARCRWAARLAQQAAEGLACAHGRGVVHRDVKPSNLLLQASPGRQAGEYHLWITDFGLAQRLEDPRLSYPGLPVGTPRYMSPEQATGQGQAGDHRTDVYSLGVTLYEVLAGRPAFTGETAAEVLHQVVHCDPPPLRQLNPSVPRDLETVVHRATARRTADRYQSARELGDDLGRWLEQLPVHVRRIGPVGRMVRWCRRTPLVAGLTLAVAALLVTVAVGATALAVQERAGADRERTARQEAEEAQQREAKARAEAEKQRDAATRALRRAEGLRLALQGQILLPSGPQRALLLAIEGVRRHRSPQTEGALLTILEASREGRTLTTPFEVRRVRFSRDGKYVLTSNGRGRTPVHLWESSTGKQVLVLAAPRAGWVASLSPTGQLLLTSGLDRRRRLWDVATGKVLHAWEGDDWGIEAGPFSPDGKAVVLSDGASNAVVWDTRTGAKRLTLAGHAARVRQALFSPDGTRIVTTSDDQTVRLWEASTGRALLTLDWLRRQVEPGVIRPPGQPILSEVKRVAFSSDGKRLLTVDSTYAARVWDTGTGKEVAVFRGMVDQARLSPDGGRVLTWVSGAQFPYLVVRDVATGKEVARCLGHEDGITAAQFSPDGRTIVSGSYDRTVRLWEAATGRQRAVLRGHQERVDDVCFSPDGQWIASASDDRTARLWRSVSEKERQTRRGLDTQLVRVSPDGARVLAPSGRSAVGVWDVQTGKQLVDQTGYLLPGGASRDGRLLLLAAGTAARVVDAGTGKDQAVLRGHEKTIARAVFSDDGKRVVTASDDGTARVWVAATGRQEVVLRGHTAGMWKAAFDPAGQRIVTASVDRTARLWDVTTGKTLAVLKGHTDEVMDVCFSADGQRVASTGRDQTLRLWDATTGRLLATVADVDWLRPLRLSPGADRLLVMGLKDRTVVRLHRLADGSEERVLKGHGGRIEEAVFSSDGKQVATAAYDGTARLWDSETGKQVHVLKRGPAGVRGVSFSPDGAWVLTVGADSSVQVWDVRTGKEVKKLLAHAGRIYSAAFLAAGKVVVALAQTSVLFWAPQTNWEVASRAGHSWQIWDASFSRDGRRAVTASFDTTARVWDVQTGRSVALLAGHEGRVVAARFSPDGKRVVTASTDRTARVWDADTGKELAVLKGHTDEVDDARFSAGGKRVLTRAKDGTARLWDAATGRLIRNFAGHEGVLSAAWLSPDGKKVLTAATGWLPLRTKMGGNLVVGSRRGTDHTARLWDADTGKELVVMKHEAGVSAAVLGPSGQVLTCSGTVVRLWDSKGKELRRWTTPRLVRRIDVSPDGKRVLTVSWDGPAQLWDATTGRLAVTLHPGPLRDGGFTRRGQQVWTLSGQGDFRLIPTDLLAEALRRRPRELTAAEREEFEILGD
jgi:WD40 repeat protein